MPQAVDISGWQKVARELQARAGVAVDQFLRDEGRLLCVELVKSTPPRRREQGENAIAADLARITETRELHYLRWLKQEFGEKITEQTVRNKRGEAYVVDHAIIDPDGENLPWWHKSQLIKSRMRTRGYGQRSWSQDIGRHTQRDKLWVSKDALNTYYENVSKRVGFMKSAWVKALFDLGGRSKGEKVPAWVERHYDNGRPQGGADTSKLTVRMVGEASLTISNWTPQVDRIMGNAITWALRKRVGGMKTRLKRGIETGDWRTQWR